MPVKDELFLADVLMCLVALMLSLSGLLIFVFFVSHFLVNAKKDDNWIQLFNKNKEIIMSLRVEKSNVKNLKGCPVNIQQADEEKAWISFVSRWLDEVNRTNGVTASGHHSWSER